MESALWKQTLSETHAPSWPCPSCIRGTLELAPHSLRYEETAASRAERKSDDWFFEMIDFAFTAWLECKKCNSKVAVAGNGGVEQYQTGEYEWDYAEYFTPKSFHPGLQLFDVPKECPEHIKTNIAQAFSLYWIDCDASANRLRTALERLMDHLAIPKKRKTKAGSFEVLKLHRRLEIYAQKERALGEQLMALKYLGNSGSHETQVTRDELLDAFEILEHALIEILQSRSKRLLAMAKELSSKHKPGARKRKPIF